MIPDETDEISRLILRIIEELAGERGSGPHSLVSGYAFIVSPGGKPAAVRIRPQEPGGLSPEVMEGEDVVHVTVSLPPGCATLPTVTFQPFVVGISLGGATAVVDLPSRIDLAGCSWQVTNGVLDISCRKA